MKMFSRFLAFVNLVFAVENIVQKPFWHFAFGIVLSLSAAVAWETAESRGAK